MRYVFLPLLAAIPLSLGTSTQMVCYSPPYKEVVVDPVQEKCLATMIWGEARGESATGMAAVAHTALNRAAKSPKSGVCGVVLAPKQYSIFNNNPALRAAALSKDLVPASKNPIDQESWRRSVLIANMVMNGTMADPTNGATAYLAPKMMKIMGYTYPRWSREYERVAIIDSHHFYKPVDKKAKAT